MAVHALLLGVDGGGTRCRARLCTSSGVKLGESVAGPANIRFGLEQGFSEVLAATAQCLKEAGLSARDLPRISACLALAGASEPAALIAAQNKAHPFGKLVVTTDAHAACLGAHGGHDGGIIIAGTGSIGWAQLRGRSYRVGGWGLPVSDEGSGSWLGCEALRRVLWARDGRIAWSPLLAALFEKFDSDPHAIVRWMSQASTRDLGSLAHQIVEHASRNDPVAVQLMRLAASHIDALAERLIALGAPRLALVGGLSPFIEPWLAQAIRSRLIAPAGDALDGALSLARSAAAAAAA
jgi:glucosamine kinase